VKQLAARWQISERQVHRFIESGALTAHRIGRSLRIAESDVLLFEFQCR
jgi:excisionase family DNA binding protein